MLVDTHAHIHFADYADRLDEILSSAAAAGVTKIVSVGVDAADSAAAIALAARHPEVYATVGLHPHDAKQADSALRRKLTALAASPKVVAIGECGLDFFKSYSDPEVQAGVFRFQIELARTLNLPMVWHVRAAFDRFFSIVDDYPGLTGIVHSFTSKRADMEKAVSRGFLVALNGIMTFTKDPAQLEAAVHLPLANLVLETDCPFLAPIPHRGQPNQPAYVKLTAEFLARLRGESFEQLAAASSANAQRLLQI